MKLTKSQRRIARTFSFPVLSIVMMALMMAIAGTN
jgi:hypothetical protein